MVPKGTAAKTSPWQPWLPLAEPDGVLVVRPGKKTRLVRTASIAFFAERANISIAK